MEQLKKKTRKLEVVAAMCQVDAEEVLHDIVVSIDKANEVIKRLPAKDDTYEWWPRWWVTFLKEW